MKTVWHILIILLAGLLVAGATYGLAQTDLAGELLGIPDGDFGGHHLNGERPEGGPDFEGTRPDGNFNRQGTDGAHHEGGPGGLNFRTTLKNLGIIGAIIAGVVLLSLLGNQVQKLHRRFKARQAVTESTSALGGSLF